MTVVSPYFQQEHHFELCNLTSATNQINLPYQHVQAVNGWLDLELTTFGPRQFLVFRWSL